MATTINARTGADRRVSPEKLEAFCVQALVNSGLREADARTTATVLVTTDMWGIFTHGTRHLRNYLRKIAAGGIDPSATPEIVSEGPAWASIDGHAAMGMVSSVMAMNLAISKAGVAGIAYVGVKNSVHFGAAGYYANMAVPHGLIGVAMSNTDPNMIAPGAKGSVIGNNPLSYAIPAGREQSIFLDIAMSSVAASKILAAKALGLPIPNNWLVDENGVPTTDTSHFPGVGSLLPMAEHKGYGLAVLIEVLAAVLTGAGVTSEAKSWMLDLNSRPNVGHAFVAIDIQMIMPLELFRDRVDRMIREIHASPVARGAQRIYLPGEIEWAKREDALRNGIALPSDVIADLIGMGQDVGVDTADLFE